MQRRIWLILILIIVLTSLLRLYRLNHYPSGLYSDEANQGYNAYSILKTGKDEHGIFLPVTLRSFGDWKPPLQTYLMIPFIKVFGLKEISVRLPGALLGIFSVVLTYFLVKKLTGAEKNSGKLTLLAAFLLAISPWHLHQSRSVMLVMVALFFFLLGFYSFLLSNKKAGFLYLCAITFALSIYSYYGMRLITPLFLLILLIMYYSWIKLNSKSFFKALLLGFFILLPLLLSFLKEPDTIFGRAKNVSVFSDQGVSLKLWELQSQDGVSQVRPKVSLFFHNKPYGYSIDILKRFFLHLQADFLFFKGDTAPPFKIPNMGVLYITEIFFLPVGVFYFLKKNKNRFVIIALLCLSILPAALTFMTPSHNRSFNAVIPLVFFMAYGIDVTIAKRILPKTILAILVGVIYLFSIYYYLNNYYVVLPNRESDQWLYGYKELVNYINLNDVKYKNIIFLPGTGMAYTYLLFYNQYPPDLFIKEAVRDYTPDRFGFEHVKGYNKYNFFEKERNNDQLRTIMGEGELYIGRENEIPEDLTKVKIFYPDGKVALRIGYL